jgi:hypothetical protein
VITVVCFSHYFIVQAPAVEEDYQDARYALEDCELEVDKVSELLDRAGEDSLLANSVGSYVTLLKDTVTNFSFASRSSSRGHKAPQFDEKEIVTKSSLVKLNANLKYAQLRARAGEKRWRVLLFRCKVLEVGSTDNLYYYSESHSGST